MAAGSGTCDTALGAAMLYLPWLAAKLVGGYAGAIELALERVTHLSEDRVLRQLLHLGRQRGARPHQQAVVEGRQRGHLRDPRHHAGDPLLSR